MPTDMSGTFGPFVGALLVHVRTGTALGAHQAAAGSWRSPGTSAGSKTRGGAWIRDVPESVPDLDGHASGEGLTLVMRDPAFGRAHVMLRTAGRPAWGPFAGPLLAVTGSSHRHHSGARIDRYRGVTNRSLA